MKQIKFGALIAIAVLGFALPSESTVIDIGVNFESGTLGAWTAAGNPFVTSTYGGQLPVTGSYLAAMSNGGGSLSASTLEATLGLLPGVLSSVGNGPVTEGSAIYRTVTVSAGDEVQFAWNFMSNELDQLAVYNDFAFFSVSPFTANELVDKNNGVFPISAVGYLGATGWNRYSYTFGASGTYTIGIGVVDVQDNAFDSALLVDQVPEPGTLLLVGSGITALALRRRRKA